MAYAISTLKSLPFGQVIGGPMQAAIEAQALAAKATVDFIKVVGFKPKAEDPFFPEDVAAEADMGDLRYVTFNYIYKDENGKTDAQATLTVPILTIVPIPFIRIDEMTIDFTAKITEDLRSAYKASQITNYSQSLGASGGGWWWCPVRVNFNSSFSSTHSSSVSSANRLKSELTMNVHVRAVQDDMPAGLSRVLDILETAIQDNRGVKEGAAAASIPASTAAPAPAKTAKG